MIAWKDDSALVGQRTTNVMVPVLPGDSVPSEACKHQSVKVRVPVDDTVTRRARYRTSVKVLVPPDGTEVMVQRVINARVGASQGDMPRAVMPRITCAMDRVLLEPTQQKDQETQANAQNVHLGDSVQVVPLLRSVKDHVLLIHSRQLVQGKQRSAKSAQRVKNAKTNAQKTLISYRKTRFWCAEIWFSCRKTNVWAWKTWFSYRKSWFLHPNLVFLQETIVFIVFLLLLFFSAFFCSSSGSEARKATGWKSIDFLQKEPMFGH